MEHGITRIRTSLYVATAALAACLAGAVAFSPTPADAVTAAEKQAEADAVYSQIDSLQTSLNEAQERYDDATSAHDDAIEKRDDASKQIEEKSQRIEDLQDELSKFAVGMYKQGGTGSYLDVLLQTTSFSDFMTSWDVCQNVSNKGSELLSEAKSAREELEQAKATYEEEAERAEKQMEVAEETLAQIENTQAALRSEAQKLSAEAAELQVQEELAAEAARQAEEARKQQEAAIAAAAEAAAAKNNGGGSSDAGSSSDSGAGSNAGSDSGSDSDSDSGSTSGGGSAGGSVLMGSGYFTNPCPSATESSGFGYRTFDNSFHKGLDMAAPEGTPYYAADSGTVMYATNGGGYNGGAGNWVVISHGNGIVTKYMHSLETFVSPGDQVTRGQNIGLVGNTGNSFGAHLHFQVEVDGVAVNPLNYI